MIPVQIKEEKYYSRFQLLNKFSCNHDKLDSILDKLTRNKIINIKVNENSEECMAVQYSMISGSFPPFPAKLKWRISNRPSRPVQTRRNREATLRWTFADEDRSTPPWTDTSPYSGWLTKTYLG